MVDLRQACDEVLKGVITGTERVPGGIAMVTDEKENIYEGAAGLRSIGSEDPMSDDTVFAILSTSKAIGGTAVLQCVEEGLLDLDAPAKDYTPEIGELQVLDGFDAEGNTQLRPPKRDITTRMLMLHTAGLGYDIFNENYNRLAQEHGQPSILTCTRASMNTPLLFDPGDKWEYGTNIDWAAKVVEGIRGKGIGEVLREYVFVPLGMEDIGFTRTDDMKARTATFHRRGKDGSLSPMDDFALPDNPEVEMTGHGLYATVPEYMKFIRMWLNDGLGPNGRVLKSETVEFAVQGGLKLPQEMVDLPAVKPDLTNGAKFFPGTAKNFGYTFMVAEEQAPTGRRAGAIGWHGLANLFYWIDRENRIGGFWATQILPFGAAVSFPGYMDFETAVYDILKA